MISMHRNIKHFMKLWQHEVTKTSFISHFHSNVLQCCLKYNISKICNISSFLMANNRVICCSSHESHFSWYSSFVSPFHTSLSCRNTDFGRIFTHNVKFKSMDGDNGFKIRFKDSDVTVIYGVQIFLILIRCIIFFKIISTAGVQNSCKYIQNTSKT
jgi:hypothetical protein